MSYPSSFSNLVMQKAPFLEGEGAPSPVHYDQNVPASLRSRQEWMGKWIATPLAVGQKLPLKKVDGVSIQEEACKWIRPNQFLAPHERLELYAQQYWWRLLEVLEEYHPLTRRVLGKEVWHHGLAVPYLNQNPPRHWSLYRVDDRLLSFLKKHPCGEHPGLTYDAACLDYAYLHAGHLPANPPLSALRGEEDLEALFSATCYTQPHLFLLEFPCDLFAFREEVLRQSGDKKDYYLKEPLPALDLVKEPRFFVLFRTPSHKVTYIELSKYAARYVRRFLEGSSIEDSLEWVETQERAMRDEVQTHLAVWLEKWIALGWFTLHASHTPS